MIEVKFYDDVDEKLMEYAVIISKYKGKWVFCRHKDRSTYECPGGHIEPGEKADDAASRELWEETGAKLYSIRRVCPYSVVKENEESFGMLYCADIEEFGELPPMEMEKVELFDELPSDWTYPLIQPKLLKKAEETGLWRRRSN